MGKPSPVLQHDDAVSLRTHPGSRFVDDDDAPELHIDDLPPLYDESVEGSSSSAPLLPVDTTPPSSLAFLQCRAKDMNTGDEIYIDKALDQNPNILENHVKAWAQAPPRPFVRIHGTHSQLVDDNGKKQRKSVTDFDVQVELTPYLYSDAINRKSWSELRTAENTEETRRGTILRKRAPGATNHIEVGLADKPTLAEWCHRYHASHAGLKSFTVERRMLGFDEDRVREKLLALVRATNYRGAVSITFPVKDKHITVYNDCKVNQWRNTPLVFWLCALTLMFIFTWPYLFFRTKRFEVVYSDWYYSVMGDNGQRKYVSISEDRWYNMWGRAINRAVLSKRQGVLDQQDLLDHSQDAVFDNALADGAMNIFRAGVTAMNEVNRQFGWGGDC